MKAKIQNSTVGFMKLHGAKFSAVSEIQKRETMKTMKQAIVKHYQWQF